MKTYPVTSLLDDSYINPTPAVYGDGTHPRGLNQITSISIHHDASPRPHEYDSVARYKQEAAYHYQILGPGLQYHFKIANVGEIFQTRPLDEWLYVVGSSENVSTIAICLDGYFHPPYNEIPTREQYEALGQLLTELCDNRGDIPVSWPNVRPHRDYSSTACCGDNLAPWITAINSKADALNIPGNAIYDHPELQPANAPTPPAQPAPPPVATINYRVFDLAGKQQGAYTGKGNAWNKYLSLNRQAKIVDGAGNDITAALATEYEPPPPPTPLPPVTPPTPSPVDQDHEKRISALEALIGRIVAFLQSIFNGFK